MIRNVVILGSTGSIGESALRVVAAHRDRFQVLALGARANHRRLLEQAREFGVGIVALAEEAAARSCAAAAPAGLTVLAGDDGLASIAALEEADIVLCALVGIAGLQPVLAALARGTDVALATKEVLVAAGGMVMEASARHQARILPVDSEHSAVFQCLEGRDMRSVRRIVLTASGGPFAHRADMDFDTVTAAEALRHPRWKMGRKVTVDSATLMNKGLEIMEAHWLFGVPVERVDVVIHPESIVHSLVEFVDGSVLAQMSMPDMRFAIQYALSWPERLPGADLPVLDLAAVGRLHFLTPDEERFPSLKLAKQAARVGGTLPAVLNAANEVAVQAFLDGRLTFAGIWKTVAAVMGAHTVVAQPSLVQVAAADAWGRAQANGICEGVRVAC